MTAACSVLPAAAFSEKTRSSLDKLMAEPLDFLVEQLVWKNDYDVERATMIVEEYRKWIAIVVAIDDALFQRACFSGSTVIPAMPSEEIDRAWHLHILFTSRYASFCHRVCGRFLHHRPATPDSRVTMDFESTLVAYHALFGDLPELWRPRSELCNGGGCDPWE